MLREIAYLQKTCSDIGFAATRDDLQSETLPTTNSSSAKLRFHIRFFPAVPYIVLSKRPNCSFAETSRNTVSAEEILLANDKFFCFVFHGISTAQFSQFIFTAAIFELFI